MIIGKKIFCCEGIFNKSVLIRLYQGVFECINIGGNQVPRPGENWSGFGRLIDSKRGSIYSHLFYNEEKQESTRAEIPDPEVEIIKNPDT